MHNSKYSKGALRLILSWWVTYIIILTCVQCSL